jgi:OmpA-OmpF porin, OOP family
MAFALSPKIKKPLIIGLCISTILGGVWYVQNKDPNWLKRTFGAESQLITGVQLPNSSINPTKEQATEKFVASPQMVKMEGITQWRHLGIPWNGQIGLIYANGGASTASGSQMDKAGINLKIERQDMYDIMTAELIKFAEDFHNGNPNPQVGAHSITIMGDGAPGVVSSVQAQLDKLGLHVKIIGATGRSLGEDKCMGKPEWSDNPQLAKGGVIAAVPRDGDQNICFMWAQNSGIKINPDGKTWDPDALNFFETNDFNAADAAFIAGTCEDRRVVKDGKPTGETKNVCVDGTATWTPGDVNVYEKLKAMNSPKQVVPLLSTRENGAQMFAVILMIDEWAMSKPNTVTNFLQAALNGSAIVANNKDELYKAAGWSAKVWGEKDADYWSKYYYGQIVTTPNSGGRQVYLGGSQALGLASNLQYFTPAGNSVYDRVYQSFGTLYQKLYPGLLPTIPKDVINPFFLQRIAQAAGTSADSGAVFGDITGNENRQVSGRSYAIQFAQGSATILPSSFDELNELLGQVNTSSNLAVSVEGHTSSEGDDATNLSLSEARAKAVRDWLIKNAPPTAQKDLTGRVKASGFGEQRLIKGASGSEDMTASRRVEVRLLSQ